VTPAPGRGGAGPLERDPEAEDPLPVEEEEEADLDPQDEHVAVKGRSHAVKSAQHAEEESDRQAKELAKVAPRPTERSEMDGLVQD